MTFGTRLYALPITGDEMQATGFLHQLISYNISFEAVKQIPHFLPPLSTLYSTDHNESQPLDLPFSGDFCGDSDLADLVGDTASGRIGAITEAALGPTAGKALFGEALPELIKEAPR